jgi:hypothetical protein
MSVIATDIPRQSLLDAKAVATAYFSDSYCIPLRSGDMAMSALFFGIFGHHPAWMKALLIVRNRIAALCGLDVPSDAAILRPVPKVHYRVGEPIGPWPIFNMAENELIVGRDNKHLDFRLSILRETIGQRAVATVSTICNVHNIYGRLYLRLIIPFHKFGLRRLLASAVQSGRV